MAVAVRLRRETTLSVKQIAARVHLGTSQTANKRLHQAMKAVPAIIRKVPPGSISENDATKSSTLLILLSYLLAQTTSHARRS